MATTREGLTLGPAGGGSWLSYTLVLAAGVVAGLSASGRDSFCVTLASLAVLLLALPPAVAGARRLPAEGPNRRRIRVAMVLAWGLLVLSVGLYHWPLRVAFALARPGLDAMAARIEGGTAIACPAWVGLFRIQRAEVRHGQTICLWLHLDEAGGTGLVRMPGPGDDVPLNVWSRLRLGEHWQLVTED